MVVRCGGVEIYKAKNPGEFTRRGFCLLLIYYLLLLLSLTITYFHTGCSTIIGATSFHGPVRDGKGWDRRAMVIRHNLWCCPVPVFWRVGQRNPGRSSKSQGFCVLAGVMHNRHTHARSITG